MFFSCIIFAPYANANKMADEALIKAIKHNNIKAAQKALSLRANVESKNMGSHSLLSFSAQKNYLEIVKLLIKHGANVNKMDAYTYPLHRAANNNEKMKSSLDIVKYLVEHGADINAIDKKGHSPLSIAVKTNNYKVATFLMDNGADPEINTPEGSILELSKKRKNLFMTNFVSRAINKIIYNKEELIVKDLIEVYNNFFKANLSGNLIDIKKTRTKKILNEMEQVYKNKGKAHLFTVLTKELAEKQEAAIKKGKFIASRLGKEYNFHSLTYNYKKARMVFYSNPIEETTYILGIMLSKIENKWKVHHIGLVKEKLNYRQTGKELVEGHLKNLDSDKNFKMR